MTSGAILVKEEREEQITYSVCGCTSSHSPTQPPHTHTPPSHTHRQEAMDHYTTHCRNADIYITHMQILTHQNGVPTNELAGDEDAADPKSATGENRRTTLTYITKL